MITYRVDRANTLHAPCGMNSILYVGDSLNKAREVFDAAEPGLSPWGEAMPSYGVLLTRWDNSTYKPLLSKGIAS